MNDKRIYGVLSQVQYVAAGQSSDPRVMKGLYKREMYGTDSYSQCGADREIQERLQIYDPISNEAYNMNSAIIHNMSLVPENLYPNCSIGGGIMTSPIYMPPNGYFVSLESRDDIWQGYVSWNPADYI